jgi:ankyrin repeat protein
MSLLSLPCELLWEISEHIHTKRDLNAFVQINCMFHQTFSRSLYRFDVRSCGSSALLWATAKNDMCKAQISLEERDRIRPEDDSLQAALQIALVKRHLAMVHLLVDRGGDINGPVGHFSTALQWSCQTSDREMLEMVIDRGAEINATDKKYGSALQIASWAADEDTIKLLLKHGAKINAQGGFLGNALQAACEAGRGKIAKLLLDHGADVNAQGGYHGTALQAACWRGDTHTVKMLLRRGADVDVGGGFFGDAYQAAWFGRHRRIQGLLRYWQWRQWFIKRQPCLS